MQSRLGRAVISTGISGIVALMAASSVASASTPPGGTVSLAPVVVMAPPVAAHRAAPHPEINGAIRSLQQAKAYLQAAAHDFNGHRADALASCDAAIKQLQIIISYDK
jgi:hypothetical protein